MNKWYDECWSHVLESFVFQARYFYFSKIVTFVRFTCAMVAISLFCGGSKHLCLIKIRVWNSVKREPFFFRNQLIAWFWLSIVASSGSGFTDESSLSFAWISSFYSNKFLITRELSFIIWYVKQLIKLQLCNTTKRLFYYINSYS